MIGLKYLPKLFKDYKECSIKTKIEFILRELKYAKQRAWRGYDNYMIWNIDNSFVELYSVILGEFKINNHSYPHNMTPKEWNDILAQLYIYLDMIKDADDNWELKIRYKDKFFELFSKHFFDLWD